VASLQDRGLLTDVGYGLPAFEAHRWWTLVSGAFFALHPVQYVPVVLGFLLLVGFAELRLGTRRAVIATVGTQAVGVAGAALFFLVASGHGWAWADQTAATLDVGFSAGALGAAAAASATLSAPWRARLRVALVAYCVISLMYIGAVWDVEHLFGVAAGLACGPALVGRRARLRPPRLSRHETRLLAACAFGYSAFASLLGTESSSGGPLTSGPDGSSTPTQGLLAAVGWLLIAVGLRRGSRLAWRWAVALSTVELVGLCGFAVWLVLTPHDGVPLTVYTIMVTGLQLSIVVVGRCAFRNPSRREVRRRSGQPARAGVGTRDRAASTLRDVGAVNHLSWMTTWPENRWFVPSTGNGYVAYRHHAGVAVGLCDPVAATADERAGMLEEFATHARAAGLLPCLFSVTQEAVDHAGVLGWHALQVAEEAVLPLADLEYRGRAWQDVRTALNQAAKLGITHRMVTLRDAPRGVQLQVRAISEQWMDEKGLPEMGFTLGGVDEALDPQVRVSLAVDAEGTVHGLTSWMPVHAPGGGAPIGWTLDVMRRLPDGFRYTMELLIASACMTFKEEGAQLVSLSGVPLARAGAGDSTTERSGLDSFLDSLGAALEPYYGFRSLQAFKAKFQPRYQPLYLVFPDEAALPRIGLALTRAYLPDAGLRDFVTLAKAPRSARPPSRAGDAWPVAAARS
jgi:lysylphosphatidylglycerol synthetase-like protein (DUF2156 family)